MSTRIWKVRDVKKCIIVPSELDNKYSRGVLGIITGSAKYPGAAVLTTASAAFIHNSAALLASRDAPISASQIIEYIPDAIRKLI